MKNYEFSGLFTFDLANNHQGDTTHALNIIKSMGVIAKNHGIKAAFKFQLRDLNTFIHPQYIHREDLPYKMK